MLSLSTPRGRVQRTASALNVCKFVLPLGVAVVTTTPVGVISICRTVWDLLMSKPSANAIGTHEYLKSNSHLSRMTSQFIDTSELFIAITLHQLTHYGQSNVIPKNQNHRLGPNDAEKDYSTGLHSQTRGLRNANRVLCDHSKTDKRLKAVMPPVQRVCPPTLSAVLLIRPTPKTTANIHVTSIILKQPLIRELC